MSEEKKIYIRFSIEDLIVPVEMEEEVPKYIEILGSSLRATLVCYQTKEGIEVDID